MKTKAIKQAKASLADLRERKGGAIGENAIEFIDSLMTEEEIAQSDLKVALIGEIIKARQDQGISQKRLESLSGVRQPIIARLESSDVNPRIDTILRLLLPLGKTLAIVPIDKR